jgi:esterase/lipase superfamily enzyme
MAVLFATNRLIDQSGSDTLVPETVGYKRNARVLYGEAAVRVPDSHHLGNVERPTDWTILSFTIRHVQENEKLHFVIKMARFLRIDEFIEDIKNNGSNGALLFVHGYGNTFSDCIFKTAQIAFDMHFGGVPICFSWPSKGGILDYDYDRESALFSRDAFLEVVHLLYNEANIKKVYVVAHSMGNQIVVDALAHAQDVGIGIDLTELVLAAPDVDRDVFRSMIKRLRIAAKGITLYASSADKALIASRIKAGGAPRAGDVPKEGPITAEGMDTIDATAIGNDLFALNHAVFSRNRVLIDDIGRLLLASTRPPDLRSPELERVPFKSDHPRYWRFPE